MTELDITSCQPYLEDSLNAHKRPPQAWSQPDQYDLSQKEDQEAVSAAFASGQIKTVYDSIRLIAGDLYEMENPANCDDSVRKEEYVSEILDQGAAFGQWFHFPWSGELVRYPDQDMHRALRTSRNRDLITTTEQSLLYEKTVAVFGLSVGRKVVERMIGSGIGGKIIIGDPDTIDPSNLNRISTGFASVGESKVHNLARDISEADPYLEQVHFMEGVTQNNLEKLAELKPDIVFDEVDNIRMKASLRGFAATQKIPLIMATDLGDRALIDVERHDLEKLRPFNGRLNLDAFERLASGNFTESEKSQYTLKIVGLRHVTTRMLESVMHVGHTLPGLPQLDATAALGGAGAAKVAREILLGNDVQSGRYVINPKQVFKLKSQASFRHGVKTVGAFLSASKHK